MGKLAIEYEGPIFQRDATAKFLDNVRDFMRDSGEDAAYRVRAAVPRRSGEYRAHVNARMKGQTGRPWLRWVSISSWGLGEGAWPTGPFRGWFNYAGRVEARWGAFSIGRKRLREIRGANRDFTKGLN